jgi:choline dehydrogenase
VGRSTSAPCSTGTNPRDPLRIRYNFFSAPYDLSTLHKCVKRAREIAYQKALDPFRRTETSPGVAVKTDAADMIRGRQPLPAVRL